MPKWKQHLDQYLESLKLILETNQDQLRFKRVTIAASDVAEQFFCEKKAAMQHLYGEVETEAKVIGVEAHEKLLEGAEAWGTPQASCLSIISLRLPHFYCLSLLKLAAKRE